MLNFLILMLIKIPAIFIALLSVLYLMYITKTYQVVEAECVSCVKQYKENNYLVRYTYMDCQDNVIEQVDKMIESNSPREKGEMYKLLVRPNQYKAKVYDKTVYGVISVVLIVAILVLSL